VRLGDCGRAIAGLKFRLYQRSLFIGILASIPRNNNRRQAVASFTGAYTGSALQLTDGNVEPFGFQMCVNLSFMLGASLASMLSTGHSVPAGTHVQFHLCVRRALFGCRESLGGHDHDGSLDDLVFYLATIANGVQNSLSSLYSGNMIRSTHFTGW